MKFVIDSSVVVAWLLPDEVDEHADRLLGGMAAHVAFAPSIWPLEVLNALRSATLRQRITHADAQAMTRSLGKLPVQLDLADSTQLLSILALAQHYAISAYDAAYLELAGRLGLPLATFDLRLSEVARTESISLTFATSA